MTVQIPLSFPVRESYDPNDFIPLPCHQEAIAWMDRFPDWPYPALVVYGEKGCGKTHYLSFFVQNKDQDVLIVDDVHRYFGDQEAENDLFHHFNLAKENGECLLLTMDKPVSQQSIQLPDLRSRLMAAPSVEIKSPSDEDLNVILRKLFHDRQLKVHDDVITYIIPRVERSFQAIRDLVCLIDDKAMAEKRAITIPFVRTFFEM